MSNNYTDCDALELARQLREREVSPQELLDAAIARAEAVNPAINAIIHPLYDEARNTIARGLPQGPFSGVPFLAKDLINSYAGTPQRMGSRYFQDYVPAQDSTLAARFKNTGVVLCGKTNTPEFGVTPITDPELYGSTRNPWHLDHSPAGSSGGSAAAVAAGIVPMASGGDGGGSIRMPAACCGLVGLKPTKGRTPTGPAEGDLWYGMAVEHVLTRSVRDCAAMLDAVHGQDDGPPSIVPDPAQPWLTDCGTEPGALRIAFSKDPMLGTSLHPDCAAAVDHTAQLLESLGHHVEEATPPIDRDAFIAAFAVVVAGDTFSQIDTAEKLLGKKARRQDFELRTWSLYQLGKAYSAGAFANALRYLQAVGRQVGQFMINYDVLLTPSCGIPPPKIGHLTPTGTDRLLLELLNRLPIKRFATRPDIAVNAAQKIYDFMAYTPIANATGQPSMSVPLYWNDEGLPIGTLLTSRFGDESTLFRLAAQLERAQPWAGRKPTGIDW